MIETLDRSLWVDLIGTPFLHRGRGPKRYDCYGLLLEIFRRRGIIVPDFTYPQHDAGQADIILQNMDIWRRIDAPRAGCGLLFRRGNVGQHVGVAIDDDRFIHASEDHNAVVVSRLRSGFPCHINQLLGAYEYAL